jgi:hypothetical protein
MEQFIGLAIAAGFSREQAEFLAENVAKYPHSHDMNEIHGLDEALADIETSLEEDDDEPLEDE